MRRRNSVSAVNRKVTGNLSEYGNISLRNFKSNGYNTIKIAIPVCLRRRNYIKVKKLFMNVCTVSSVKHILNIEIWSNIHP